MPEEKTIITALPFLNHNILVRTANYTIKYVTKNVVNKSFILTNISFYMPNFDYTAAVFL